MENESRFYGMTVNERLNVDGLINDFDRYLKQKYIEGIKSILKKVELNKNSILQIIENLKIEN
jgi:hypothetical protein